MNKLSKCLAIPFISLTILAGCLKKDRTKEFLINGSIYSVSADRIIQTRSSFLNDGKIKIGAVSDIEGAIENAKISSERLKTESIDALIIAGDCYENEQIRRNPVYPNSKDNVKEMIDGVEPYANIGVPIFIIAGNHEDRSVYKKAIRKLNEKHHNIFDINNRSIDLQGLNIVGMGGYHHQNFTTPDGFLLNNSDYSRTEKSLEELQKQKELNVLITHGPPKSKTLIDYVNGAGHVGDTKITDIMNNTNLKDILNIHGHIHEGGNNSDSYKSGKSKNIASITDYNNPSRIPNIEVIIVK